MRQRITSLGFLALLAGCNSPTPPSPLVDTPHAAPVQLEPVPEPEPVPAEEPSPISHEPKVHIDDPAMVARLHKLAEEREALGTKVFQAGVAIDGFMHAGTAFNEIHVPEHQCWVLGQMLGKAGIVKPVECLSPTATYASSADERPTSPSLKPRARIRSSLP